ncbi:hypothetical protein BYT27DRAFT_6662913 [Phlegmacium glaucopus]|nr:hypothetical protein BYT27DRAFT_6662913 [Phlegmacium glaucopus]
MRLPPKYPWYRLEDGLHAVEEIEEKKSVPPGYWKQFQLAEKCFLHQRVYCPTEGKLVYLTEVTGDWNDDYEAYFGSDMDTILAKKIALGDVDPMTGLPMDDINPGFIPRVLKPLLLVANSPGKKQGQKTRKLANWRYSKLLWSKSHRTSTYKAEHTTRSHQTGVKW